MPARLVRDADKRPPPGEVAFPVVTGDGCGYPEVIGAYDAVAEWVKTNGRDFDGSPRERYLFDPAAGEEPRMEIAWPIR